LHCTASPIIYRHYLSWMRRDPVDRGFRRRSCCCFPPVMTNRGAHSHGVLATNAACAFGGGFQDWRGDCLDSGKATTTACARNRGRRSRTSDRNAHASDWYASWPVSLGGSNPKARQ
jgi:hypothetical protein